jgi:hypothetical protein
MQLIKSWIQLCVYCVGVSGKAATSYAPTDIPHLSTATSASKSCRLQSDCL